MQILIFKPNDGVYTEENGSSNLQESKIFPYSLAICAAVLKQEKFRINVLDAAAEELNQEQSLEQIKAYHPDIIIMTLNCITAENSLHGLDYLKKKLQFKLICLVNMNFVSELMQRYSQIDIIIRFEWPWALKDTLIALDNRISLKTVRGIYYRQKHRIISTKKRLHRSIKDWPLPALELFPTKKYDIFFTFWTAGCNYNCIFCHYGPYPKSGWEHREIDSIIAELKLFKKYGDKYIINMDNELTMNPSFVKALCQRIIKEKINIVFEGNTRASHYDEEMFKLLSAAGCVHLGYGIESGNQTILDINQKQITLNDILITEKLLHKYRITSKGYFLIGLYAETKKTIRDTFRFVLTALHTKNLGMGISIPYPGTRFYYLLQKEKRISKFNISNLIWIHKNCYNWKLLKGIYAEKPAWKISEDINFNKLTSIYTKYYPLLPKRSLYHSLYRLTNLKYSKWILKQCLINPKLIFKKTLALIK